jgi:fructose-bisphosphate aldolase class 1
MKRCVQAYSYAKLIRFENLIFVIEKERQRCKNNEDMKLEKDMTRSYIMMKASFLSQKNVRMMIVSLKKRFARILLPRTPPAYFARMKNP